MAIQLNTNTVLLTGGSGFVGSYLLRALLERGLDVRCLVRSTSNQDEIKKQNVLTVLGDLSDRESLERAVSGVDVVFHVAGSMKALTGKEMMRVNGEGTGNLISVCAECESPPVFVLISSIAAAGTAIQDRPRRETDDCKPVSQYGHSKRAGELAVAAFADRLPVTVIRPPFVFGGGDRSGLYLFRPIWRFGIHPVPGMRHHRQMSLIHAADLAKGVLLAAERGTRVQRADAERDHFRQGCYFVSDAENLRYSQLGDLIGRVMGRRRIMKLPAPDLLAKAVGGAATCLAYLRNRPAVFSLDKAREGAAGSWICSPETIQQELGFAPAASLEDRLRETVAWYRSRKWF